MVNMKLLVFFIIVLWKFLSFKIDLYLMMNSNLTQLLMLSLFFHFHFLFFHFHLLPLFIPTASLISSLFLSHSTQFFSKRCHYNNNKTFFCIKVNCMLCAKWSISILHLVFLLYLSCEFHCFTVKLICEVVFWN